MTDLPAPLTPPEADLSGVNGFVLDAVRLIGSDLAATASGDGFRAAVLLWSRAFLQKPHGSLPDSDRILAAFVGMSEKKFKKIRAEALHGFVKCSDGRLYHPVLCADVNRALERRARQRERTKAATEARASRQQPRPPRASEGDDGKGGGGRANDERNEHRNDERNDERNEVPYPIRSNPIRSFQIDSSPPDGGVPHQPDIGSDDLHRAFDAYNAIAQAAGLPLARKLTKPRAASLRLRLRDCDGLPGWHAALRRLAASGFLTGKIPGRDGRPFLADFDFMVQAKSFQRLQEGSYDDKAAVPSRRDATLAALDAIASGATAG